MSVSPTQLAAIRYFAGQYGRFWKMRLRRIWWSGQDESLPNGALLRQIRNEFGPVWLDSFVLTGDKSIDAEDQQQAKLIVERVASILEASLSSWDHSTAKEWIYTTCSIDEYRVRVGVSTGGAISINGSPHTLDGKRIIKNNHLFELTLLEKMKMKKVS